MPDDTTSNDEARGVSLSAKELEAIMWTLAEVGDRPDREPDDAADPLWVLLQSHPRDAVMAACARMEAALDEPLLEPPATDVERDLLRVCVENSSWTASYRNSADTAYNRMLLFEADSALITLAVKLDVLDIKVNRFPGDPPSAS